MLETKNLFELTFIPVSCYSPEVLKKKHIGQVMHGT